MARTSENNPVQGSPDQAEQHNSSQSWRGGANQTGPVFREKSLNHVVARKYSHAYLKGSGPIIWMAGIAVAIIIFAIAVWTVFASPEYLVTILMNGAVN